MNLIGHLASAHDMHETARVGSILPDLVPIYDRRCKVAPLIKHWAGVVAADPALGQVSAGIEFHLMVDARFHRLPLFREPYRGLRQALETASDTPGLKRILPAHVLLEMFLDHLLLRDRPALQDDFNGLLAGHGRLIERFCAPQPRFDAPGFRVFLASILGDRFLEEYGSMDGLLARMNRIQQRYGQRALEPAEADAVRGYLAANQRRLGDELNAFVQAAAAHSSEFAAPARPKPAGQARQRMGGALSA